MWAMDVLIVELFASEVGWYCIALVVVLFRSDGVLRLCKRRGRGEAEERGEEEGMLKKKGGIKVFLVDTSRSAYSPSLIHSNNRTGHMQ